MRRVVHLHGKFAAYHDGPIEIIASTIWEVIEAVSLQVRGFAPGLDGHQRVQVAGFSTFEDLKRRDTQTVDIHIFPALAFGKEGGLIQTIIGTVLVVASFLLPAGPWTPMLMSTGITMIIGGVMQMLSPVPQLNSGNESEQRSKYLPSSQNTVAIGTPIPLLYGRYRVGGHILSLNIDATDTGI